MAPSPPLAEPNVEPPGRGRTDALAALDAAERCWRDALSFVAAGDVAGAADEVERADLLLAELAGVGSHADEARTRLSDAELARIAAGMSRLTRLHSELIAATRAAQARIGHELAAARRGKAALAAYGAQVPDSHHCDAVG